MIPMTNPLKLKFPCLLIKAGDLVKETHDEVIFEEGTLVKQNISKGTAIKGSVIASLHDFFTIRYKGPAFIFDYNNKVLYELTRSVKVTLSVRKIKCITDLYFFCQGYSFPLDHNIKQDKCSNSLTLLAKLAIWEDIPIFLELTNGYTESRNKYRI